MKPVSCTLIINTASGYEMAPIECKSISEAVKLGRESYAFAYRIFVDGRIVRRGYCH